MTTQFDSTVRSADVLRSLWKQKWSIAAFTLIIAVLGFTWVARIPRSYTATSSVVFAAPSASLAQPAPQSGAQKAISAAVVKAVARKYAHMSPDRLTSMLSVSSNALTPGADITVQGNDPQLVVKLANELAGEGLRQWKKTDSLAEARAAVVLSRKKLDWLDKALRKIKDHRGSSIDPAAIAGTALLEIQKLEVQQQLKDAELTIPDIRASSMTAATSAKLASPSKLSVTLWSLLAGFVAAATLSFGLQQLTRAKRPN